MLSLHEAEPQYDWMFSCDKSVDRYVSTRGGGVFLQITNLDQLPNKKYWQQERNEIQDYINDLDGNAVLKVAWKEIMSTSTVRYQNIKSLFDIKSTPYRI